MPPTLPGAGEGWCWAPRAARALPHQTGHWGCLGYRHPFLALPSVAGPEQRGAEGQRPRVTAFLVLPMPEVFAGFHRWKRVSLHLSQQVVIGLLCPRTCPYTVPTPHEKLR